MGFMQNPYVFGATIVIVTAVAMYAYQYTIEPEPEKSKKTLYKTLAAGGLAVLAVTYLTHRPEQLANEPFNATASDAIPS
jgi:hypothetical protein